MEAITVDKISTAATVKLEPVYMNGKPMGGINCEMKRPVLACAQSHSIDKKRVPAAYMPAMKAD